jgi:hypothetical protein
MPDAREDRASEHARTPRRTRGNGSLPPGRDPSAFCAELGRRATRGPLGNAGPFGQRRPFWATQALRVQKLYQKVVALLFAQGKLSIGNLSMAAEGVCQI